MARRTQTKTAKVTPPSPATPDPGNFRPATYWGGLDPIVATIKGQVRRRRVLELLAAGRPDAIDAVLLAAGLSSEVARFLGAIKPWLTAGENLPDFNPGEVEIARIVLWTPRLMVISLRAQRARDRIGLSVVNDRAAALIIPNCRSVIGQPLSQNDLVDLIENLRTPPTVAPEPGIIHESLVPRLAEGMPAESVAGLVEVDSVYYPGLSEAYAARIRAWCASRAEMLAAAAAASGPLRVRSTPHRGPVSRRRQDGKSALA